MRTPLSAVPIENGALSAREIRWLVGKDDPVIIELGANVGQTTEQFLTEMPQAHIYCFEPEPRAIERFRKRISSPNVKLFECAAGAENGTVVFNQSSGDAARKDWNESGSIRKPKLHLQTWPWVKFDSQIEVQLIRLDDWAKTETLGAVDFIWADTQGAEEDVIRGGLNVIDNSRFFYTEYGAQEWYEGQISLGAMYDLLPGFSVLRLFSLDVLFENMRRNR